jgi:YbbR domain-containing protein
MKIKSYFVNNFGLKVTALCLALFVWAGISGKEHSYAERNLEVNVEYFNAAESINVSSVRPEKVRLRVRGTSRELERINPGDYNIKIDLKGVTEETRLNYFTEDYLQYPEDMRPVSIHPRWIEVTVKEFASREVPIRVRYRGDMKPGVALVNRRLKPEKVRIFGYKSEIEDIEVVEAVEWVNLSIIEKNSVIRIPLKKSKDILRFEDVDSVEVHVTVINNNIRDKSDAETKNDKGKNGQIKNN